MKQNTTTKYCSIPTKERLAAWKKIEGMWKDKKLDPIKEHKRMREEWK